MRKRAECRLIGRMMRDATGERPYMWGSSIVGYGSSRYRYESGREGGWFLCGYSPRAQNLTIYIMPGFSGFAPVLSKLGKSRTGKSCLYIRPLDDVTQDVLRELIDRAVAVMRSRYQTE